MVTGRGLKPPRTLQELVCSEMLDQSRGKQMGGTAKAQNFCHILLSLRGNFAFATVSFP